MTTTTTRTEKTPRPSDPGADARTPAPGEALDFGETGVEAAPYAEAPTREEVSAQLAALRGRRVAVALSGGVDSAVAAHRLVEAGAQVVGLALRLHDPDPGNPLAPRACCPPDDLQDARRVAEQLGFPFYVIDARGAFDAEVVRPFVTSYLGGRTPNPCVGCNAFVKLERLHRRARALGCVGLATGHYARVRPVPGAGQGTQLFAGADRAKDQSYFLFGTAPAILRDLVFPLGASTKDEIRAEALATGLPVAHKLESQEVCFVGGAGAGGFVLRQPEAQGDHAGPIVDESGAQIGTHSGIAGYTVGQRKGLGVAAPHPLHVLSIHPDSKTLVAGPAKRLMKSGLVAKNASWPAGVPEGPVRARVRIRYRDAGTEGWVHPEGEGAKVTFDAPVKAISPGQAAVFYRGDEVLGGAWIEGALD